MDFSLFKKQLSVIFFVLVGFACIILNFADAKPTGFSLKSGDANISFQDDASLVIQSSKNSVVNWDGFSINANELVHFQQMNDSGYVLNRVVGSDASSLLGTLTSNKAVYLINPNGILIGPNAYVETAGFIVSTLDLPDEDLSNKIFSFSGNSEKGIVNQGKIHCPAGDIFLIGKTVENSGELSSPQGRTGLLSGSDVMVFPDKAPCVRIHSDERIDNEILQENPYALAIRHSGKAQGNKIYLAAEKGLCRVSGEITATGITGGDVQITGEYIHLIDEAIVDVSGENGGGSVIIGGGFQGKDPSIPHAMIVWAGKDTKVKADALINGDGGKVVFWSDKATCFYGRISVKGGEKGGDGGFAEVSGPYLEYRGFTYATAEHGKPGTLLLDPNDINIGSNPTTGTWSAPPCPSTYNVVVGTNPNEILNAGLNSLQTQLNDCNVTINTASLGGGAGAIVILQPVTWAADTTLTLIATTSITVSAALISTAAATVNADPLINLTAGSYIAVNAPLSSSSTTTGQDAIRLTASGTSAGTNPGVRIVSNITASGGNITVNGTSAASASSSHGVYFNGGKIITTAGNINVTGIVPLGPSAGSYYGILVASINPCDSTSGNITLTGQSQGSAFDCNGFNCTYVYGVSWALSTNGTLTIGTEANPCQGGRGNSPHGINFQPTTFSTQGPVSMYGVAGRGLAANTNAHGVILGGASIINGSLNATGRTTDNSDGTGIYLISGTTQTTGSSTITLLGRHGNSCAGRAVLIEGGKIQSASGAISVTGLGGTTAGGSVGVWLSTTNSITSTSGAVTIIGDITGSSGATYPGVLINGSLTTGTSGKVTFLNCKGGSGATSHGVNFNNTFSTGGDLELTTCIGGTVGAGSGDGVYVSATGTGVTATGSITASGLIGNGNGGRGFDLNKNFTSTNGNISITAIATGTAGECNGIRLNSGILRTQGGGTITLIGTGGPSSGYSDGIALLGGSVSGTTGGGSINLTGIGSGSSITYGIWTNTLNGIVTSGSGTITLSGQTTATGTASYGIGVTNALNTGTTTGLVTFQNCTGGSGQTSHGVEFSLTFTTAGGVAFTNCQGGNNVTAGGNGVNIINGAFTAGRAITATNAEGNGTASRGFVSSQNLTALSEGINISAASNGTSGACHGISIAGATMSAAAGGAITLYGEGGASGTASHGVNISGGIVSASGGGNIDLTGIASGSGASYGINMAAVNGVVTSGTGTIGIHGQSSSSGASSYGVNIASAWTTSTAGLVTFSNCTGGSGASGHGIFVGAAFSTTGSVAATAAIQGNGSGGVGFYANNNFTSTGAGGNISITASALGSSGACQGIALTGGALSTQAGGAVTLNGTGGSSSDAASHGIQINGGSISAATGGGNIDLTGIASGSGASYGINTATANGVVTSGTGTIGIHGQSSSSGASSYGVNIASAWTTSTAGLVTFSNCTGGSGASGHGIFVGAAFSTTGSVTATAAIQGNGSGGRGFDLNSNFTSTGAGGNISITASAAGTTGSCNGIRLNSGILSTQGGGTITLSGTGGPSSGFSDGITLSGGSVSGITGGGSINLTGIGSGSSITYGIWMNTLNGIVTSGSGTITLSGQTTATGTASYGIGVSAAWNTGTTTGLVTFQNCTGGSGQSNHGVNFFSTFTTAGGVTFTNCQGGNNVTAGGNGVNIINGAFNAGDAITATGAEGNGTASIGFFSNQNLTALSGGINISAASNGTSGACHGISIAGAIMSAAAGGAITLYGEGGASGTASHGVNISGGSISAVTGGGNIDLTGIASGSGASHGINMATANGVVTSGAGTIGVHGQSSSSGASSYGVNIASAWTTGTTTGLVTFSNCTGGSGASGHGIYVGNAFSTAGSVAATAAIQGNGSGGRGFDLNSNFTSTGAGGNISITASAAGTTGSCNGIRLNSGILSTQGGGTITLSGTGGPSSGFSDGIALSGGSVSGTTGGGNIDLTGIASGSGASHGINMATVNGVVTSGTGTIGVHGQSSSSGASSYGVNIASAWTTSTAGLVTFSNCTGGSGASGHGIYVGDAFSTTGSVTATAAIQGNGSGGTGFYANNNFTSTAGSISITALANGTDGACHGISLVNGTLSIGGSDTITLHGTGGASTDTASHGINISGGIISAVAGGGNISLTGLTSASAVSGYGVNMATANGIITSGVGTTVTVSGTSLAANSNSYGVSVTQPWSVGSSNSLTITGAGGAGSASHGIYLGAALTNTGAITLNGTSGAGAGSYGSSIGANITTGGGVITVTGSSLVSNNIILDATNAGASPAGADINFSGAGATINAAVAGSQSLDLRAGTGGAAVFGGAIGQTTKLGDLTVTSAKTTANAVNIASNITANSFTITTASPATLTGSAVIDTTASGAISFGGTIDAAAAGVQSLTLTAGGVITLPDQIGSTARLNAFSVTAASSFILGNNAAANSFSVSSPVPMVLTKVGVTAINTSAANGDISIQGTINGTNNELQAFTLNPGLGNISLGDTIGNIVPLGAISITNATNVTMSDTLSAASLTQSLGSNTTTFNGSLSFSGSMNLTGTKFTFNAPVSTATNVTVNNSGLLLINSLGDISISGFFLQSAAGPVQTAGDITTAGQNITFTGGVTLIGSVYFDTGGTLGDISLLSAVDGNYNLTLNAKNITFASTVQTRNLSAVADTINIGADQTVSYGPMNYTGLVVLTADAVLTDQGVNGIYFQPDISGDSITGNFDLDLSAASSSITVGGDVDLSGSIGSAGGDLNASGMSDLTFSGGVSTAGGNNAIGAGGAGGSVTLSSSAESVSVNSINTSGGNGAAGGGNAGNISIQPAGGYSGGLPVGKIVLNNDLTASPGTGGGGAGGTISLSASRSSSATVATITSSLLGNDVNITADSCVIGSYEAMTVLGNLVFTCDTLTLGDLVVLNDLSISASSSTLLTHGERLILDNQGNLYPSSNLHFYSGQNYSAIGTFVPDGPVNAGSLGLSEAEFEPLLIYDQNILNYDIYVPPIPEYAKQYIRYKLAVAEANFFDRLPIFQSTLLPPYLFRKTEREEEKILPQKDDLNNEKFKNENYFMFL